MGCASIWLKPSRLIEADQHSQKIVRLQPPDFLILQGHVMNSNRSKSHEAPPGVSTMPAERSDAEFRHQYGDVAEKVNAVFYEDITRELDAYFTNIGATVLRGVSYAGEDPASFHIQSQLPSSDYSNRPV
jgi:hypothetical protein